MNIRELSIGDWVQNPLGAIGWVNYIRFFHRDRGDNYGGCYSIEMAYSKDGDSYCTLEENEIKPIPITAEILEKNGWKYEFDKEEYRVKYMLGEQGKNCWIMWSCKYHIIDIQRQDADLDMYNLCITKVCAPCEYVHQLQHALRLSELPDLADNFKV